MTATDRHPETRAEWQPAATSSASTNSQTERARRALCSRLFAEPGRLVQTLTHAIDEPFHIAPHAHAGVLQLDLLVQCAGEAWVDDRVLTPLSALTALVAYPGQRHGYHLEPGPPEAPRTPGRGTTRVYHLKLAVDPDWPVVRERALSESVTALPPTELLVAAFRAVTRLGLVEPMRFSPLLLVRLAELLCLWPNGRDGGTAQLPGSAADDAQLDQRMGGAFELIEQRLHAPPDLAELAKVSHFSPRHFARRFRQLYGCTPHAYITARRFAMARQLLTQDRLNVSHVADVLGFGSVATFSRWFTQHAGVSPSRYRQDPMVM